MIIHIFILNSVESYESTRPHDDSALLEKLEILAAEYENDDKIEIVPKVQPERFEFLPMTLPEPKTIFQDLRVSNPDAPKGIFSRLTPTLSAWPLRSHWALKLIL